MLGKVLKAITGVFKYHKLKILTFIGATLFFVLVLFPYGDLGDYVTTKVSQLTNQQIYVRFDNLDLKLFPGPGLQMQKVFLETPFLPALTIDDLVVSPSIAGLVTFRPGVSARAKGFMGGDASLSTRGGPKSEAGTPTQIISLDTSSVSLQQLAKMARLPLPLRGQVTMSTKTTVDPAFAVQPEGDVQLDIQKFELVAANVPTPFGPINVPQVNVSELNISGRITDGRLIIEEARLGRKGDDISGSLKGDIGLRIDGRGGAVSVTPGAYNLDLDIVVSKGLSERAGLLLMLLDSYKRPDSGGSRYAVRIQGQNFLMPPRISAR